ncbi:hypothetical protein O181_072637 [Austropuccinia psidii MF-1]|uniref:Uncharacterized protein n=1 Tax=Austropuccinia psidii MF-1 TaxID=1389203 RepID=A0A9Q3F9T2_9BASI|nr:hypothetical protein [Austropuccinia psidii MF-1]
MLRFWIGKKNSYLQVKKLLGLEKTQELLKGWKPMYCKGKVKNIKSWLKNQSILSEDQKKELAQKKGNSPVEAPKASKSRKASPKEKPEVQAQMEQALPPELQNSKEGKDSYGKCAKYGRNFDGIRKQGGGKN